MAKKDKTDETPIEFYIPGPGGKKSRVPILVNQSNWIYKRNLNTKPSVSEWFIIVVILVVALALSILIIVSSLQSSPLWIVVITLVAFAIFLIRSAIIRTSNYTQETEEDENIISARKRKKKQPKHRKDYK